MTFSLRFIEENDLDFVTEIRKDPEVAENLGTFLLLSKEKQKIWFDNLIVDRTRMYLIFEKNDISIGYVRMSEIDYVNRSICVGGDIHKNYRGKGYGHEMYDFILNLCFDQLNMNRVWLFVLESNKRAKHLYQKHGFKEEGKQRQAIYRNGKYIDYIMMSILKDEFHKL